MNLAPSNKTIDALKSLSLKEASRIELVWLYGSQANHTADCASDYDLAIALHKECNQADKFIQDLEYQWSNNLDQNISIVDINSVPVPLAYNIIDLGTPLYIGNDLRLHSEEQRIWSLWSEYAHEHQQHYP
ncbi:MULTISPECIES: nucleotidyltransferase domain-containing protein [unclassified Oleiphilus]|jgi:predicted nucleotidyltransferase|uniref:type VII toxin-antitoxin system MntA family adenylyltransferase antitoxin n=3 Tax=Oleiphilus TaxID=141450 RepID=UPI0007C2A5DE|nr:MULTISPECIES: nucleotidyltransferase domain-containing protein [unclassified Oleiphilus]KZY45270.1 hypothetical protein A3732_10700 [Oleiphilus sp. HI0050]KZY73464.1 hypothetical protein A3740_19010 [Oleiphilus sp. HI0068]KZY80464.1 hypothetical protein A3741_05505 [Oleiphilus sp. HI0069]KZZ32214.1 hypothetical protein A3755_10210 [Oleiphilus sp. HI0085]KZY36935.1 hypothetical protein A3729_16795 [Oleiphilus sp. HI0043]